MNRNNKNIMPDFKQKHVSRISTPLSLKYIVTYQNCLHGLPVLCYLNLNIEIRLRALKCYVFSVVILLYTAEAWTVTEISGKSMEALEM